jgi:hypothetical protein
MGWKYCGDWSTFQKGERGYDYYKENQSAVNGDFDIDDGRRSDGKQEG